LILWIIAKLFALQTDAELGTEKQELEAFKEEISHFADLVSKSPWIPEIEKVHAFASLWE